jgi:hypothetical protein
MKKAMLLFLICSLLYSCNDDNQKIKDSIKDEMNKTLKDFSSYEVVEIKILDTIYVKEDLMEAKKLLKYLPKYGKYEAESTRLNNLKLNDKDISRFRILHKYRAKNGFGAYGLSEDIISLDKNFKYAGNNKEMFTVRQNTLR